MINRTVDVQPVTDGSHTIGYIAKGHITREELETAIRRAFDAEFEIDALDPRCISRTDSGRCQTAWEMLSYAT
jgi:hypothetical protein